MSAKLKVLKERTAFTLDSLNVSLRLQPGEKSEMESLSVRIAAELIRSSSVSKFAAAVQKVQREEEGLKE